jgi:hypothetical protein
MKFNFLFRHLARPTVKPGFHVTTVRDKKQDGEWHLRFHKMPHGEVLLIEQRFQPSARRLF